MNSHSSLTSACRYCRFYTPEGRRGGRCERLDVGVLGQWQACTLAMPPFSESWSSLKPLSSLQPLTPSLKPLAYPLMEVAVDVPANVPLTCSPT
ncbi:hypothetical protein [Prochlorothrix hollandica]